MSDPKPGFFKCDQIDAEHFVIKWTGFGPTGGCLRLVLGQVPTVKRLLAEAGYTEEAEKGRTK